MRGQVIYRAVLVGLFVLCACGCTVASFGHPRRGSVGGVYHQVSVGDTLHTIGQHYGVPYSRIAFLNGIHNPDSLLVGQKLLIAYTNHHRMASKGLDPKKQFAAIRKPSKNKASIPYTNGKLFWPIQHGGRLVSLFGPRGRSFHDGVDIVASRGTPINACHSGVIVYAGSKLRGYGKLLLLKSSDGVVTVYAHNRKLLVKKGQHVRRGDKIAEVGSTGKSSGPHLHLEVRIKDKKGRYVAVDPMPFFRPNSKKPRFRVNENLAPILAKSP